MLVAAVTLALLLSSGCTNPGASGSGGGGSGGAGGGGTSASVSGNWQIQVTPSSSPAPFTSLAGFINEEGPGGNQFVTAALQAQPGGCYTAAATIPMYGGTTGSGLSLVSFSVNGQVLTINADVNATGTQFTGNYSIAGGCAAGASGTVTGTVYAAVNGTYAGSVTGSSPAETLNLTLAQSAQGNGDGTFSVSGTAAFTGIPCFTQGSLSSLNGSVLGDSITLTFNTNDAQGAQLRLTGTLDTAAHTLTFPSVLVTAGTCQGSLGAATLTLQ